MLLAPTRSQTRTLPSNNPERSGRVCAFFATSSRALRPGSSVLDLGCGNGVPALREIARLHRAVGVDISKTQTELARANVPHADLVHADVAELAFPARSCDAVVAFYLFDHLPREEHATLLARVREWLTPDGLFLFSVEGEGPTGGRRGVAREADVL